MKLLSFDLDDTLCDTQFANQAGYDEMKKLVNTIYQHKIDSDEFVSKYNKGIHRIFTPFQKNIFEPITNEHTFRLKLIENILTDLDINFPVNTDIISIQKCFDDNRLKYFDFFPNVKKLLIDLRKDYKIAVITNGPVFSQRPKVETIQLEKYVDMIIIGGEESYQKPHISIFNKMLTAFNVLPEDAIHIGDSHECDVIGARNAGLKTVWITEQKNMSNNDCDFNVSTVLDLNRILKTLN